MNVTVSIVSRYNGTVMRLPKEQFYFLLSLTKYRELISNDKDKMLDINPYGFKRMIIDKKITTIDDKVDTDVYRFGKESKDLMHFVIKEKASQHLNIFNTKLLIVALQNNKVAHIITPSEEINISVRDNNIFISKKKIANKDE